MTVRAAVVTGLGDAVTDALPTSPDLVIISVAGVLLAAVAAVRVSVRSGLPSLLLYLGIGMLLGEDALGIGFDDAQLAQVLGFGALVLILAEGGLTTRWEGIRTSLAPAGVLATFGTVVSLVLTGLAAWLVLEVDLVTAMLLGAVVASTDSAAVFSVLRQVRLPRRIIGMLEAESGLNDAPAVLAVLALTLSAVGRNEDPWWLTVLLAAGALVVGVVVGGAVGRLGAMLLRRIALPAAGPFPLAVVAVVALAYGLAVLGGGSGFIAVYVCALVLGNARLPHGGATRGFATSLGWLAQIGLFVLLGLLATPSRLPDVLLPALAVVAALVLVGRPVSVVLSTVWFRVPWRDQVFLSWAGLRGAVPIVLATIPTLAGVPGAERIFDVTFVVVVVSVLLQAPTLPWVARRLGLADEVVPEDLEVESAPLGRSGADLVEIAVHDRSRLHGVSIQELRLPQPAHVALVLRDDGAMVPSPTTTLRHGDDMLVVVTPAVREQVEQRLRAVSEGGRLAQWDPGPGSRAGTPGPSRRSPRATGVPTRRGTTDSVDRDVPGSRGRRADGAER